MHTKARICEISEHWRLKKDPTSFLRDTKINSSSRGGRFTQRGSRIKMSQTKATLETRRYCFLTSKTTSTHTFNQM